MQEENEQLKNNENLRQLQQRPSKIEKLLIVVQDAQRVVAQTEKKKNNNNF